MPFSASPLLAAPVLASPTTFLPVLYLGRLLVAGVWRLVAQSALRMLLAAWGNGQDKCVEADLPPEVFLL